MTGLILPAGPGKFSVVAATLAQAFQTDPALSWILPDSAHRCAGMIIPCKRSAVFAIDPTGLS
ncbi:MAG: hypothetical protein Q7T68_15250 [Sphingopyxis sp.]|nr:hypothetical protein [Sphingopyxis sp.]